MYSIQYKSHIIQILSVCQALAARNKELNQLREEFSTRSSSIISKHSQDLAAEREKAMQVDATI